MNNSVKRAKKQKLQNICTALDNFYETGFLFSQTKIEPFALCLIKTWQKKFESSLFV